MQKTKKKKLEDAGWRTGSAEEFLELSPAESAFVEMKLTLSSTLRDRRKKQGLSQVELARRLGSSQSRVAKMEASDASVTLDLLIRALLAAGVSPKEIGRAVGKLPSQTKTATSSHAVR